MSESGGTSNLGKALLVVALLLGAFLIFRTFVGASDPYSVDKLSEDVSIRCDETGKEWTINRGRMERLLRTRYNGEDGLVDPLEGIVNPDTGKPTGFPVNRESDWDATIERINDEKVAASQQGRRRG